MAWCSVVSVYAALCCLYITTMAGICMLLSLATVAFLFLNSG